MVLKKKLEKCWKRCNTIVWEQNTNFYDRIIPLPYVLPHLQIPPYLWNHRPRIWSGKTIWSCQCSHSTAPTCDNTRHDVDVPRRNTDGKNIKPCVLHVLVCPPNPSNVLDFPDTPWKIVILDSATHILIAYHSSLFSPRGDIEKVWNSSHLTKIPLFVGCTIDQISRNQPSSRRLFTHSILWNFLAKKVILLFEENIYNPRTKRQTVTVAQTQMTIIIGFRQ